MWIMEFIREAHQQAAIKSSDTSANDLEDTIIL